MSDKIEKQVVIKVVADNKEQLDKIIKDVDKINSGVADIGETSKKSEKGIDSLSRGFKGVGLAIKAMGIGLLLGALDKLKDIFMSNQTVVDTFSTAMNFLKIIFNDLFKLIETNAGPVIDKFKAIFNDPQKALKDLGDAIKANLIERFVSLLDTLGYVSSAISKVFKGDFKGALEDAKKGGKELFDVASGVNNSFDKSVVAITNAANAISDYASKTWDASASITQLIKDLDKQALVQERLALQFQTDAEKQRQIRDDTSKSIQERINANNKLADILVKQGNAERATVNARINALQQQNALLGVTTERTNEIYGLQTSLIDINERITGQQSEQKVNVTGLNNEMKAYNQTSIDGANQRLIAEKKFNDSLIKDTTDRLAAERQSIIDAAKLQDDALKLKRDQEDKGTQAYVDAEQERLNAKQAADQAIIANDRATTEALLAENKLRTDSILSNDVLAFQERFNALSEQEEAAEIAEYTSTEERNKALLELRKARTDLELEFEAKKDEAIAMSKQSLSNIINGLEESGLAKSKAGQAISKAIALTQIGIDSAVAISKASTLANAEGTAAQLAFPMVPGAGTIARVVSYASTALQVVSNIARAKKLLSSGGSSGGGGGSSSGGGAPAPQANFNVVGQSNTNILADTIANKQQQPVEAFVVGNSVTEQQELDRNKIQNSTFL